MKILITESQLTLLTEVDRRDIIINKLGFSQEWANEFHNLSDKYSLWIASSFFDDCKSTYRESNGNNISLENFKKIINEEPVFWYRWKASRVGEYRYILDWLRNPLTQNIDLKNLSFKDAYRLADEWHKELKRKVESNFKETNEIIRDYRNSKGIGFYWVNLGKSHCDEESKRMGHCGTGDGSLFSLRSIEPNGDGKSHVTLDYIKDGMVGDFKGPHNSKPLPKYKKMIMDILTQQKYPIKQLLKRVYKPETNFNLSDLSKEELDYVLSKNHYLRHDITSPETYPYIVEDIINGDLNINQFTIKQLVGLALKTNNQNFVDKIVEANKDTSLGTNRSFLYFGLNNNVYFDNERFFPLFGKAINDELKTSIIKRDKENFKQIIKLINEKLWKHANLLCDSINAGFDKFNDLYKELINEKNGLYKYYLVLKCVPEYYDQIKDKVIIVDEYDYEHDYYFAKTYLGIDLSFGKENGDYVELDVYFTLSPHEDEGLFIHSLEIKYPTKVYINNQDEIDAFERNNPKTFEFIYSLTDDLKYAYFEYMRG